MSGANDDRILRDYYRGSQGVPREVLIAADRDFSMARAYSVDQLGMTVVISRDGRIHWKGAWGGEEATLFPAIEEAAAS